MEIKHQKSIPGIGTINAVKIIARVVTPYRFAQKGIPGTGIPGTAYITIAITRMIYEEDRLQFHGPNHLMPISVRFARP